MKKVIINLIRKKSKLIILIVVIFILINIGTGVVLMEETFKDTKRKLLEIYKPIVTVEHDYSSMNEIHNTDLLYESLDKIEKSKYVRALEIETTLQLETSYLEQYYPCNISNTNSIEKDFSVEKIAVFQLSDKNIPNIEVIKGHNINKNNEYYDKEVIISQQLADQNKIGIGDKIIFTPLLDEENKIFMEIEFVVVGISKKAPLAIKDNKGNVVESYDPYANTIYTSKSVIEEVNLIISEENEKYHNNKNKQRIESFAIFYLNKFEDIEDFEVENKSFIPNEYTFKNNYETYREVENPIKKIDTTIKYIMIGTIIVSILIIVMIVIVFIKTYTPDYIYLNLFHNKKYNIILQTLVLVIGISTIAILISLYSGEKLFEKVSGKFIETIALEEIKNENVKTSISLFGNNESKITADDIVDLYTVNLNTRLILLIYIVNMGCMVLATLISIFYVLKRKPNYIQW